MIKIYFAGSITGGRDDKETYLEIIKTLKTFGMVLTEHIGDSKLSVNGENLSADYIYSRDVKWLNEADVVIADVSTPSLGVGYEIGHIESKKPILCLYRHQLDRRLSAMIAGNKNISKYQYHGVAEIRTAVETFLRENNLI